MPNSEISEILLEWQSLDAYPHERSKKWYSIGAILVLAFAAYGLFDGSWSTALVALGIGGVYFLLRSHPPRQMTVRITGLGVQVDGTLTPWNLLRNFWILTSTGKIELHLSPTRLLQPEGVVFLDEIDPAHVRDMLLRFLPERAGMEERTLDSLARLLKL